MLSYRIKKFFHRSEKLISASDDNLSLLEEAKETDAEVLQHQAKIQDLEEKIEAKKKDQAPFTFVRQKIERLLELDNKDEKDLKEGQKIFHELKNKLDEQKRKDLKHLQIGVHKDGDHLVQAPNPNGLVPAHPVFILDFDPLNREYQAGLSRYCDSFKAQEDKLQAHINNWQKEIEVIQEKIHKLYEEQQASPRFMMR